jgi:hypothetical protein
MPVSRSPKTLVPIIQNWLEGIYSSEQFYTTIPRIGKVSIFSEKFRYLGKKKSRSYNVVYKARLLAQQKWCGFNDYREFHMIPDLFKYLKKCDPDTECFCKISATGDYESTKPLGGRDSLGKLYTYIMLDGSHNIHLGAIGHGGTESSPEW